MGWRQGQWSQGRRRRRRDTQSKWDVKLGRWRVDKAEEDTWGRGWEEVTVVIIMRKKVNRTSFSKRASIVKACEVVWGRRSIEQVPLSQSDLFHFKMHWVNLQTFFISDLRQCRIDSEAITSATNCQLHLNQNNPTSRRSSVYFQIVVWPCCKCPSKILDQWVQKLQMSLFRDWGKNTSEGEMFDIQCE